MKWIGALLLVACTQTSPCEVKGGRCTRVDFDCSANQAFAGYDPLCQPNVKCCLPLGAELMDSGSTSVSCSGEFKGTCQAVALSCPSNTDAILGTSCGRDQQCCAPNCSARMGKCVPSGSSCPGGFHVDFAGCPQLDDTCCLP